MPSDSDQSFFSYINTYLELKKKKHNTVSIKIISLT